jgi:hypothetical protein
MFTGRISAATSATTAPTTATTAAGTAPTTAAGTAPQKRNVALRRGMAGALMAAAITATALGVAANSYADTGAHTPTTHTAPTLPANNTTPKPVGIDGFGNGTPGYHPTPHHRNAW